MSETRSSEMVTPGLSDDHCWHAVCDNDPAADALFVYAVRTTGVFCRPSCSSRRPRRANVLFFNTAAAAVAAGFRACKRCRPDTTRLVPPTVQARMTRACRLLESAENSPTMTSLARQVHLSPFHFQRLFKNTIGLTPHQYAQARRGENLRNALANGDRVTDAMSNNNIYSSGHFHAVAKHALGMSPRQYRAGGPGKTIRFALGECALGALLVAGTERGICAIELGENAAEMLETFQARFSQATLVGDDAAFQQHVARVAAFVARPAEDLALPLDLQGTVFQRRVWQALCDIPPGETATYAEVAARIGAPRATRAVANACGANRCALAIPCHRVLRSDGALGGYRWHIDRKRALLAREAAARSARD